jgi:hypothetical protein
MRRFTPLAASPAIDNYWIETGTENRYFPAKMTSPAYPLRVDLRSDDLRSPVTAFSAALDISEA